MSQSAAPNPQADADRLEAAADEAIAACGGDVRDALKAMIVANEFLELEVCKLIRAVSHAYVRKDQDIYRLILGRPRDGVTPMAEDEETATARYIASNVSTQLMLKTMFEIIATMADDPEKYRSGLRKKLLELADSMPLAPMSAEREKKVRAFVKETVGNLLINQRPN